MNWNRNFFLKSFVGLSPNVQQPKATHTHCICVCVCVYIYTYIYIYLLYVWMKWSKSHSVVSDSLLPHGLYSPWNSPGHYTGVDSLSLLQGPGLLHCRRILYQLSHKASYLSVSILTSTIYLLPYFCLICSCFFLGRGDTGVIEEHTGVLYYYSSTGMCLKS